MFGDFSTMPVWKPEYLDCPFCDHILVIAATYLRYGVYEKAFTLPDGAVLRTTIAVTDHITAYTIVVQCGATMIHRHSSDPAITSVDDIRTAPLALLLEAFCGFTAYYMTHPAA